MIGEEVDELARQEELINRDREDEYEESSQGPSSVTFEELRARLRKLGGKRK